MKTLGLHEAAAFLHCHPEELRRRAKAGGIPGAKAGRAWVFLEDDLAAYLRSLYAQPRQALQVTLRKEMDHVTSQTRWHLVGRHCRSQRGTNTPNYWD